MSDRDPAGHEDDVDRCDGDVLLVADPVSQHVECYGPYDSLAAAEAELIDVCAGLAVAGLTDVVLTLARWRARGLDRSRGTTWAHRPSRPS